MSDRCVGDCQSVGSRPSHDTDVDADGGEVVGDLSADLTEAEDEC
ncbi:Uncharacterised protein [Mycobacteroides abscessus subsp. abscessus]|nr:Uncharacterised protein [Mycobacteroides abscessus subsp. abscessus]